jgi:hypothetical protein
MPYPRSHQRLSRDSLRMRGRPAFRCSVADRSPFASPFDAPSATRSGGRMRSEIARHQCARRDANRRINLWRREELTTKTDASDEEIGIAILFFGGVATSRRSLSRAEENSQWRLQRFSFHAGGCLQGLFSRHLLMPLTVRRPDNTNDVLALAFGLLIVILVVVGSLSITFNLNANMMPPAELMNVHMQH